MKITEYISQGIHSINPLNESMWLGRAIKPIKGHLKWALPVAILAGAVFYFGFWRSPTQDKPQKIPLPEKKQASAEEFCSQHGIKFESAILGEIDAIRRAFEDWTDTDDIRIWNSRIRELETQMKKLPQDAELTQYINDLKKPKQDVDVKTIYKSFMALLDSRVADEEEKEKLFLPTIASALQEKKESASLTFDQYLEKAVPEGLFEYYKNALGERGVVSLADLDVLNIRYGDPLLQTLEDFQCVLRRFPENESVLQAFRSFLINFRQQMDDERDWSQLSLGAQPSIEDSIQSCKELYKEKQCELFDLYIDQFECAEHWVRLRENKPTMTLVELQTIYGVENNYYQLSTFLDWENN